MRFQVQGNDKSTSVADKRHHHHVASVLNTATNTATPCSTRFLARFLDSVTLLSVLDTALLKVLEWYLATTALVTT